MDFPTDFAVEKVTFTIQPTEMNVTPPFVFTGLTFTTTDLPTASADSMAITRDQILDVVVEAFKFMNQKLAELTDAPQAFLRSDSLTVSFSGSAYDGGYVDTSPEEEV